MAGPLHFNNAGAGVPCAQVNDAIHRYLRLERELGPNESEAVHSYCLIALVRESLARLLGSVPDEIVLFDCATRAWSSLVGNPLQGPSPGLASLSHRRNPPRRQRRVSAVPASAAASGRRSSAGTRCLAQWRPRQVNYLTFPLRGTSLCVGPAGGGSGAVNVGDGRKHDARRTPRPPSTVWSWDLTHRRSENHRAALVHGGGRLP